MDSTPVLVFYYYWLVVLSIAIGSIITWKGHRSQQHWTLVEELNRFTCPATFELLKSYAGTIAIKTPADCVGFTTISTVRNTSIQTHIVIFKLTIAITMMIDDDWDLWYQCLHMWIAQRTHNTLYYYCPHSWSHYYIMVSIFLLIQEFQRSRLTRNSNFCSVKVLAASLVMAAKGGDS